MMYVVKLCIHNTHGVSPGANGATRGFVDPCITDTRALPMVYHILVIVCPPFEEASRMFTVAKSIIHKLRLDDHQWSGTCMHYNDGSNHMKRK